MNSEEAVTARQSDLSRADAIGKLLIRPIAILPKVVGDPIKPFVIGLWNDIQPLRRTDVSSTALRRALGAYLHSKAYFLALAQPGAFRFDLDGSRD